MMLVKLRRGGQVTLPVDARRKLELAEGDYLEAEVIENGLLLRPLSEIAREKALEQMMGAKARVEAAPEQAKKSPEQQEREIFEEVKAMRREYANQDRPR